MEQTRKHLKISSLIVLLFAALSLLNIVSELLFGDLNNATIPEGSPDNILLITKIILLVFSLVLLAPQIYIGFKGLKMAKNPDSSKAHIVWAIILFVLSIVGLISPAIAIVKQDNVFEHVSEFFSIVLEAVIFYDYIRCARAVSKEK